MSVSPGHNDALVEVMVVAIFCRLWVRLERVHQRIVARAMRVSFQPHGKGARYLALSSVFWVSPIAA